ncbi:glutamate--cysteine ligase [Streptomyces sp. NBRC 110611]|uniref:carboxylate-amine ligase n=1 Tax=Streptomyces sp. NBRC 110611 TaxID=1621259 RepID=UPI00082D6D7A|nr:glutamate--cysteine ligase [Streptomyces sp. NBRC 110611]
MRESYAVGAVGAGARAGRGELTVGVEEEFILADPVTREAVLTANGVVETADRLAGHGQVVAELALGQVETVGGVCSDARQLRAEVTRLRRCAARAAHEAGHLLVACGTAPLGDPGPPPVVDTRRNHAITAQFRSLVDQQCVNACHVHVGVPDPEEAVQVVNHLRPWTPLLLALTANSPFCLGRDTGHASWRAMLWGRWPTAAPPPYLRSADHYERVVSALVDSGAAMDPAMVYWSVRPSRHVPTVEIRVADVLPGAEDTVAYALLVRGLVATALTKIRKGEPAPPVEDSVLRAAAWRAARDGMSGRLPAVPLPGPVRTVPAWYLATALVMRVQGHLHAAGDFDTVRRWLSRLQGHGTGAARQRAVYRRTERLENVVDTLAVPLHEHAAPDSDRDPDHSPAPDHGPGPGPDHGPGPRPGAGPDDRTTYDTAQPT